MGRPAKYEPEYRESAVAVVRETGKPIAPVARELGINDSALGNWVNADRRRRGQQHDDQVEESQRAELVWLRRENAQLRMEKEIGERLKHWLQEFLCLAPIWCSPSSVRWFSFTRDPQPRACPAI